MITPVPNLTSRTWDLRTSGRFMKFLCSFHCMEGKQISSTCLPFPTLLPVAPSFGNEFNGEQLLRHAVSSSLDAAAARMYGCLQRSNRVLQGQRRNHRFALQSIGAAGDRTDHRQLNWGAFSRAKYRRLGTKARLLLAIPLQASWLTFLRLSKRCIRELTVDGGRRMCE